MLKLMWLIFLLGFAGCASKIRPITTAEWWDVQARLNWFEEGIRQDREILRYHVHRKGCTNETPDEKACRSCPAPVDSNRMCD